MTVKQPDRSSAAEPERGLVLAVLAPGADAADELAELEELARTALRRAGRPGRPAPARCPIRAPTSAKGKLDELKQAYGEAGQRC